MTPAADLIRIKRDGGRLSDAQIQELVSQISGGQLGDAQLGAWLMAVYLRGMNTSEQAALTLAMRDSGTVMRWEDWDGPVLDKHSTGGVGDLVSLVLAPLIAACGGYVPMISGRGLGHTGGTLDKLESIPGLSIELDRERFHRIVSAAGFAMAGQGPDLAPADQRMYATRDVTATVSCRPLIIASILSKKLAEGLDGLVMDIKTGNGAIIRDPAAAQLLGEEICAVAEAAGLPCSALLTDMNQPLAYSAGNALEMKEAIDFLTGGLKNHRLEQVIMGLCAELLVTSGLADDELQARQRLRQKLDDGSAAERFAHMCSLQGGPADLLDQPTSHLPRASLQVPVPAPEDGYIVHMDTREFGRVVNALGGGRQRAGDEIDPAVGLAGIVPFGEWVGRGDPLMIIHANEMSAAESAASQLLGALTLGDQQPQPDPVIHRRIGSSSRQENP